MANIQQSYILGQPFNTYSLNELTSQNPEGWIWHGRTLKQYKINGLCSEIPIGGKVQIDDTHAFISGVWELNKYTLIGSGITLCCLGQSGGITMSVSAANGYLPLGDAGHLYTNQISVTQTSNVTGFYIGTDLSIEIIPDDGTVIKSIYTESLGDTEFWEDDYVSKQTGHVYVNGNTVNVPLTAIMNCKGVPCNNEEFPVLGVFEDAGCIISVDYQQDETVDLADTTMDIARKWENDHWTDWTYTGEPITPNVKLITIAGAVVPRSAYNLVYYSNMNAGTILVVAEANPDSGYIGSKSGTFEIKPVDISEAESFIQEQDA